LTFDRFNINGRFPFLYFIQIFFFFFVSHRKSYTTKFFNLNSNSFNAAKISYSVWISTQSIYADCCATGGFDGLDMSHFPKKCFNWPTFYFIFLFLKFYFSRSGVRKKTVG
jgi:hypothetical protein